MAAEPEQTALEVIRALKSIPEYANLRVAVIGGLARMHYDTHPDGRVTRDVDFVVDTPEMSIGPEIKNAICNLPGFNFRIRDGACYHPYQNAQDATRYHRVKFVSGAICPYLLSAAQEVQNIPANTVPYISLTDLIVFKFGSCGMRALPTKKEIDARDARALLGMATAPLVLTPDQQAIVENALKDVMDNANSIIPRSLWRRRLGLPREGDEENEEDGEPREGDEESEEDGEDDSVWVDNWPRKEREKEIGEGWAWDDDSADEPDSEENGGPDGEEDAKEEGEESGEEDAEERGEEDNNFFYFSSFFRVSFSGVALFDIGWVSVAGVRH
ncbi:hypothetical protein C8A00DRAFT_14312 [Chaetomidium leptoderma]|uniref:Uncharacterized protein n=1 Tax=Chaetomidium leptoderma TaxID=669021 RepID=A0AAN6VQN0_9PEZI|nr:hypothetical protein C8A00DRAFT_14312 [Chaetomidium leptoderma]